MGGGVVVVLGTGIAAALARFRRLGNLNAPLGTHGLPRVSTYPACPRLKFGDGRPGKVRFAADITVGTASCTGAFAALVLDADTPAILRRGALGAPRGQSDFS